MLNRKANAGLLVDDIMVAPLIGTAGAVIYDDVTGAISATVDIGGGTTRNLADSRGLFRCWHQCRGSGERSSRLPSCPAIHASPEFAFPARYPNATTSITAVVGGAFANFTQGDAWKHVREIDDAAAVAGIGGLPRICRGDRRKDGHVRTLGGLQRSWRSGDGWAGQRPDGNLAPVSGPIGLDLGADLAVRWALRSQWPSPWAARHTRCWTHHSPMIGHCSHQETRSASDFGAVLRGRTARFQRREYARRDWRRA